MTETTETTTPTPGTPRASDLRTTTVEDLLREWPATADVFFRHRMAGEQPTLRGGGFPGVSR